MKALLLIAVMAFVAAPMIVGQDKDGHADGPKHVTVKPDAIKWGPAPPGLPPGARMAVLVGDPTKTGVPYVARAKMPDGYRVPPHWHPADENITVLKGTLVVGTGERFDLAGAEEMTTGSFVRMPKNMRHFAVAKGETIIQLHGTEAFEINYIDPADDPRKAEEKK